MYQPTTHYKMCMGITIEYLVKRLLAEVVFFTILQNDIPNNLPPAGYSVQTKVIKVAKKEGGNHSNGTLNNTEMLIVQTSMEEWDPAINDFVLRCSSCWRTSKQHVKIIRTSREKYYCEKCLGIYDLCHS